MRLEWILIAKGIGVVLVVVGHFWPADSPAYWTEVRRVIYTFHMPLFFFLSGWLYEYGKYSYRELVYSKTQRLLYPFAAIAVLFFLIKFTAGLFFVLENPLVYSDLYTIVVNPILSYMPSLWYLHSLFMIFAIYPILRRFISDVLLLIIFTGLNISLDSDVSWCGTMLYNIPFFITGIVIRNKEETLAKWLNCSMLTFSSLTLIFIGACYALKIHINRDISGQYPIIFTAGICGTLIVNIVSRKLVSSDMPAIRSLLTLMGMYSISIYLFHTLFESSTRIVLTQAIRGFRLPFEFVLVTSVFNGLLFSLALEKYLLRKYYITRRFFLGIH